MCIFVNALFFMQTPKSRWLFIYKLIIETSFRVYRGAASLCSAGQSSWWEVASHQWYVGYFGVLEEHSQNAHAAMF